jgi:hypothetical protein
MHFEVGKEEMIYLALHNPLLYISAEVRPSDRHILIFHLQKTCDRKTMLSPTTTKALHSFTSDILSRA